MKPDEPLQTLIEQGKDILVRLILHPFRTIGLWILQATLAIIAFVFTLSGGIVLTRNDPGATLASIICLLLGLSCTCGFYKACKVK